MEFNHAQTAFEHIYHLIKRKGVEREDSRSLFNIGFTLMNPMKNSIDTCWRNWKHDYAEQEWQWYLSGNPSAKEIAKKASIWKNCMDSVGNVNSNYGYQWNRGDQINYVVKELINNPLSRRASISIYDAKDRYNFERDTPCTYAINFKILDGKLDMSVMMRSNDLWFGFCNDQYCFSKLQEMISVKLRLPVGKYYHFTNDLHLYTSHLNRSEDLLSKKINQPKKFDSRVENYQDKLDFANSISCLNVAEAIAKCGGSREFKLLYKEFKNGKKIH